MAGENQFHDLALPRRQVGDCRPRPRARRQLARIPRLFERASTLASSSSRLIGFSMKSEAPAFIACTAIGTSLLPVIMIAGSRWPASAAAAAIQARSCRADRHRSAGMLRARDDRPQGSLAGRVILDDPALFLEHARADRRAYMVVIVDDEDRWAAPNGSGASAVRGVAAGAAACGVGRRRRMACVSSFSFTGLLSCTQSRSAMSRKASVDMSPVRMMTGIARCSSSRSFAVTWSPSMPFGRL